MFDFVFPFELDGKKYAARCEDFRQTSRIFQCHIQDKGLLDKYGDGGPFRLSWNHLTKTVDIPFASPDHTPLLQALRTGITRFLEEKKSF